MKPCNCYYGEDCTKTTVCANESIVEDLEGRIAELEAVRDAAKEFIGVCYPIGNENGPHDRLELALANIEGEK